MIENWRDIPGHEGRYMVSDLGRVRSPYRTLQQFTDKDGYLCVTLPSGRTRVHRIVLRTFVGPKPPGLVTRHDNGIRTDNRLSNLLYGTPQENTDDRLRHGTHQFGEQNPKVKLTRADVEFIRAKPYQRGLYGKLAQRFGVTRTTVSYIARGRSWKELH